MVHPKTMLKHRQAIIHQTQSQQTQSRWHISSVAQKNIWLSVFAVSLSISLLGCAQSAAQPTNEPPKTPETPAPEQPTVRFGQVASPLASPAVVGSPDIASLVEKVQPAVVNITTRTTRPMMRMLDPFEFFFGPGNNPFGQNNPFRQHPPGQPRIPKEQSLGSGFVIDADGYVVTNSHVIENADEIVVRFADDKRYDAKVIGRDSRLDIALLQLKNAPKLLPVVLGDSDAVRVGEYVVAVGNPFGLGHTVTMGIVSAKDRTIGAGPYDDFIQTDASINPGNSGGPLFNLRGELVGINTAIHRQGQGIGFAIPINMVRSSILQLKQHGHVSRGKLGLIFQPVTEDIASALRLAQPKGALVAEVQSPSPAQRAGLKPGDLITHVNGVELVRSHDLAKLIAANRPGTSVNITYLRAGKKYSCSVVLDALEEETRDSTMPAPKDNKAHSTFGITLQQQTDGSVVVSQVADKLSDKLFVGDVIIAVDGIAIKQPSQVTVALNAAKKQGRLALFQVRRQNVTLFVAVDPKN